MRRRRHVRRAVAGPNAHQRPEALRRTKTAARQHLWPPRREDSPAAGRWLRRCGTRVSGGESGGATPFHGGAAVGVVVALRRRLHAQRGRRHAQAGLAGRTHHRRCRSSICSAPTSSATTATCSSPPSPNRCSGLAREVDPPFIDAHRPLATDGGHWTTEDGRCLLEEMVAVYRFDFDPAPHWTTRGQAIDDLPRDQR